MSTALTVKRKAGAVWAVAKRCMPLLFLVALLLLNKELLTQVCASLFKGGAEAGAEAAHMAAAAVAERAEEAAHMAASAATDAAAAAAASS